MKKWNFRQFSDAVFISLSVFAAAYAITAVYAKKRLPSLIAALACAAIALSVYALRANKKNSLAAVKKEDEETFRKYLSALTFGEKEKTDEFLFNLLEKENKKPVKTDFGVITADGEFFTAEFLPEKRSANDVLASYRHTPKGCRLTVLSSEYTEECFTLREYIPVKLLTFSEIFPLVKKHGITIDGGYLPKKKKFSLKNTLISSFDRKKAGKFAFYGFMLLVLSRFAFFPLWYAVSGTAFIAYAAAIVLFAKTEKPSPL